MSPASTSSDKSLSGAELLRLTFPDRSALEREIATNLRYGRIWISELLNFPLLTHGVIVIEHPVTHRELRLPAQIVMLNSDGPMYGTGLALRAFGPPEVEQLEGFAREAISGSAPRPASSADTAQAAGRANPQPSAADAPVGRDRERSQAAANLRSRTATSGVQSAAVQRAGAPVDRAHGHPRSPPSTATSSLRQPAQEVGAPAARARAASPTERVRFEGAGAAPPPRAARGRTASSTANTVLPRPAQEINRTDLNDERAHSVPQAKVVRPRPARSAARPRVSGPVDEAGDWSDFEHEPDPTPRMLEPEPPIPTAPLAKEPLTPGPRADTLAKQPEPSIDDDDWSDFEHGPEPGAIATPANVETAPAAAPASPLPAADVKAPEPAADEPSGFTIPYDPAAAAKRAPSAAFVSSPHTAVTYRPPPKDGSDD